MAFAALRDYIIDNFGRPLTGVSVTVKYNTVGDGSGANPGDVAPIKTDRAGGTPLSNPFTNESDGSWLFWADIRNTYDIVFSKSGVTFDNTDFTDHDVGFLPNDVVTTAKILNLNVTTAKLADNAVTIVKINTGAVTEPKILDSAVSSAKIANLAVTDAKIASAGITTRSKLPTALAYEDEANIFVSKQVIQVANNTDILTLKRNGASSAWWGIDWDFDSGGLAMRLYYDSGTNEFRIQDTTTDVLKMNLTGGGITLSVAAPSTPVANTLYKDSIIKGWVYFTDVAGTPTLQDDLNVDGTIIDNSTGNYSIVWITDFTNINYAIIGSSEGNTAVGVVAASKNAGSTRVVVYDTSGVLTDSNVSIIAIGDQT